MRDLKYLIEYLFYYKSLERGPTLHRIHVEDVRARVILYVLYGYLGTVRTAVSLP